jgi:hypothetical protein
MLNIDNLRKARGMYTKLLDIPNNLADPDKKRKLFQKHLTDILPLTKKIEGIEIDASYAGQLSELKLALNKEVHKFVYQLLEVDDRNNMDFEEAYSNFYDFIDRKIDAIPEWNKNEDGQEEEKESHQEDDNGPRQDNDPRKELRNNLRQLFGCETENDEAVAADENCTNPKSKMKINRTNKIISELEELLSDQLRRHTYIALLKRSMPEDCADLQYQMSNDKLQKESVDDIEHFPDFLSPDDTDETVAEEAEFQLLKANKHYKSNLSNNVLLFNKNENGEFSVRNTSYVAPFLGMNKTDSMYANMEEIILLQSQGCNKISLGFNTNKPGFKPGNFMDQKELSRRQKSRLLAQLSWQYNIYLAKQDTEITQEYQKFPRDSYIIHGDNYYYHDEKGWLHDIQSGEILTNPVAVEEIIDSTDNSSDMRAMDVDAGSVSNESDNSDLLNVDGFKDKCATTFLRIKKTISEKVNDFLSEWHIFDRLSLKNNDQTVFANRVGFSSLAQHKKFNDRIVDCCMKSMKITVDVQDKSITISDGSNSKVFRNNQWSENDLVALNTSVSGHNDGGWSAAEKQQLGLALEKLGISGPIGVNNLSIYNGQFYCKAQPKIVPGDKTAELLTYQKAQAYINDKQYNENYSIYNAVKLAANQSPSMNTKRYKRRDDHDDTAEDQLQQHVGSFRTVPRG